MNNSDYINASTIVRTRKYNISTANIFLFCFYRRRFVLQTDHDPRNPAYIATQGPLTETSADFWQMVWEQGCVVIVMLTRLVENDVMLCHRYWPQEGSELYHIYEVTNISQRTETLQIRRAPNE